MSTEKNGQRYLVVSSDSHAGPHARDDLRQYCPPEYLSAYDEFVTKSEEVEAAYAAESTGSPDPLEVEAMERTTTCAGQTDAKARLADMDESGIAAEVIFAGGQNGQPMPFAGYGSAATPRSSGIDAGALEIDRKLRAVGGHMWNEWLADFVHESPERLLGVMQIPIYDVEAATAEVRWGREAGLRAVNLPAPRHDYAPYGDMSYEPFFAACEELQVPLMTHAGGGEPVLGAPGKDEMDGCTAAEIHWLSRRGLWQLIFGGVFDRHPGLKVVFTEQRVAWVPGTLQELDSAWHGAESIRAQCAKPPSEYWPDNCFLSGSFLAAYEAKMHHEVGVGNLLWGSDYPHSEGTWPNTRLAMRKTFSDIPEEEVRIILGEAALGVFNLDESFLRPIADRIGPTPAELATPLAPEEHPAWRGYAFREIGSFA